MILQAVSLTVDIELEMAVINWENFEPLVLFSSVMIDRVINKN